MFYKLGITCKNVCNIARIARVYVHFNFVKYILMNRESVLLDFLAQRFSRIVCFGSSSAHSNSCNTLLVLTGGGIEISH